MWEHQNGLNISLSFLPSENQFYESPLMTYNFAVNDYFPALLLKVVHHMIAVNAALHYYSHNAM